MTKHILHTAGQSPYDEIFRALELAPGSRQGRIAAVINAENGSIAKVIIGNKNLELVYVCKNRFPPEATDGIMFLFFCICELTDLALWRISWCEEWGILSVGQLEVKWIQK